MLGNSMRHARRKSQGDTMIVNYAVDKKMQHDVDLGTEQMLINEIDFDDMELEMEDDFDD